MLSIAYPTFRPFHKVSLPHLYVLMRYSSPKMHQIQHFLRLCPGPAGGDYSTSPDPLAGEAATLQEPLPALGPSGLEHRPFGPCTQHTHILFHGAAAYAITYITYLLFTKHYSKTVISSLFLEYCKYVIFGDHNIWTPTFCQKINCRT